MDADRSAVVWPCQTGEAILDRNLCFVEATGGVADLVTHPMLRLASGSVLHLEALRMLGGDGGPLVHAVLYLVVDSESARLGCEP